MSQLKRGLNPTRLSRDPSPMPELIIMLKKNPPNSFSLLSSLLGRVEQAAVATYPPESPTSIEFITTVAGLFQNAASDRAMMNEDATRSKRRNVPLTNSALLYFCLRVARLLPVKSLKE